VLGEHYRGDSLVIQTGAGHFDLIKPAIWRPHLDAAIEAARTGRAGVSGTSEKHRDQ
jgi:hypothetical protein